MNSKYPCKNCLVKPSCSKFCDECIGYYSRLIRAYAQNGETSYLYKRAKKDVPYRSLIIKSALNGYFNIRVRNVFSGQIIYFNRKGTIIKNI